MKSERARKWNKNQAIYNKQEQYKLRSNNKPGEEGNSLVQDGSHPRPN